MISDEFMLMAGNEHPMPEDLTPPQQWLYQSLRCLYKSHRMGIVSKEMAALEKIQLLKAYGKASDDYAGFLSGNRQWADAIKKSELQRIAIRKGLDSGTDVAGLLQIACQCISDMTGDQTVQEKVKQCNVN